MWSDESGVGTDQNSQAGIWQSGGGLVSDIPGRIILTTGNGVSPAAGRVQRTPGDAVGVRRRPHGRPAGKLTPTQFFAPSNAPTLDENDEDLGSGGPIALPTEYFGTKAIPHLVVQVGKDGRIFLIDADDMGGYRQGPGEGDAVLQTLGPYGGVWGHPAAYGGQGGWVYVLESAGGGYLRALSYGLNGDGEPPLTSAATSRNPSATPPARRWSRATGRPPAAPSSGSSTPAGPKGARGQLRAYAAMPTGGNLPLLWSAHIGTASKFAVPTAYEGRVYVGTRAGICSPSGPRRRPRSGRARRTRLGARRRKRNADAVGLGDPR